MIEKLQAIAKNWWSKNEKEIANRMLTLKKCNFCTESQWLSKFKTRDDTIVSVCEFCQEMSKNVSNPYIII